MENKFVVNGKEIELTEEVLEAMRIIVNAIGAEKVEEVKEAIPKQYDLYDGDIYYYPSGTNLDINENECLKDRDLKAFESKNKNTLERAMKWIELQNYADQVNTDGCFAMWYLYCDLAHMKIHTAKRGEWVSSDIYFTSQEAAQGALKHFGDDFLITLMLRK